MVHERSETLWAPVGAFQVGVMEEKIKLSNLKSVDSAGSLHQKYQELLKAMQGKDELIGQLQAQLEKQVGVNVGQCEAEPGSPLGICIRWPRCP